jgi:hypothetical protein
LSCAALAACSSGGGSSGGSGGATVTTGTGNTGGEDSGGSGGTTVATGTGNTGGGGFGGSGGAVTTGTGQTGGGGICAPGATEPCYSGPAGTEGIGVCIAGSRTCNAAGTAYGPCTGEVTPVDETCATSQDDDCDGLTNEEGLGCICIPGSLSSCYSGPPGTEGVGACIAGQHFCGPEGTSYGPCTGEVTPVAETCNTADDDDCDGQINEEGVGCVCAPSSTAPCYTGPANTEGVGPCVGGTKTCNAQGTAYGGCAGEWIPVAETCNTPGDDDCDGLVNEEGLGCLCIPGSISSCYSGPPGTENVGACAAGQQACKPDGTGYGPCTGEVTPVAETCNTAADDDCDGQINEEGVGCAICVPGSTTSCYSGPPGTQNVGACIAGQQTCNPDGTAYGPCVGQVTPVAETCNTFVDDDCDGLTNEGGAACVCVPLEVAWCYWGPPETLNVGACHAGYKLCSPDGLFWSGCQTQYTPQAETCLTTVDDDCDGQVNEEGAGCVCLPNSSTSCYTGAGNTAGVGVCHAGTKTCNAWGTAFGACIGEVVPLPAEDCGTFEDDDCDGQVNEGC